MYYGANNNMDNVPTYLIKHLEHQREASRKLKLYSKNIMAALNVLNVFGNLPMDIIVHILLFFDPPFEGWTERDKRTSISFAMMLHKRQ